MLQILMLVSAFCLSQELKVEGNLNVTGAVINDSLVQVIDSLKVELEEHKSLIEELQAQILQLGEMFGLVDCNGDFGGDATEDVCGVCDSDLSNDCYQDCLGEWGGDAELDYCGICNGNGLIYGDSGCCEHEVDECGICYGDGISEDECDCNGNIFDCTGLCAGTNDCTVFDIDGNGYSTVVIGSQIWLQQNLKVTKFNNGESIQYVQREELDGDLWENADFSWLLTPMYGYYNDDLIHQLVYGNFYNWYALNDGRGICPEGWHVPSRDEWNVLTQYLGESCEAGGKMKSTGTINEENGLWNPPNDGATNLSEFNGYPAGQRSGYSGVDEFVGLLTKYWSSGTTSWNSEYVHFTELHHNNSCAPLYYTSRKEDGLSIRCIQD